MKYVVVNRLDGSIEPITAIELIESIGFDRWLSEIIQNGLPVLSESGQEVYISLL